MPNFRYRAVDQTGKAVTGDLVAATEMAAVQQLRQQKLLPVSITAVSDDGKAIIAADGSRRKNKKRAGADDVLFFTGKLALLLRSGLPLVKAMQVMRGMLSNQQMIAVVDGLIDRVKAGAPLSDALAEHDRLFGALYVSMVRAGEQGGNLDKVLGELTEHLERAKVLRSSVISALIYPSILALVAVVSVFLLLGFVVPRFEVLFSNMGQALPLPTQIVISLGHATAKYGWIGIIMVIVIALLWRQAMRRPEAQLKRDRFLLRIPLIGDLIVKYETTVFSRTLGTLLNSGVPIIRAVPIAVQTVRNRHIHQSIARTQGDIKEGARLSDTLARSGVFTELGVQMLRVGEESGRVDEMLIDLARVYDSDVQELIKRGLALLEPALILGLGTVIGAIITAILMGILSVNNLAT